MPTRLAPNPPPPNRHYRPELLAFAEALGAAVTTTADAKGLFPENHPQFIGARWGVCLGVEFGWVCVCVCWAPACPGCLAAGGGHLSVW